MPKTSDPSSEFVFAKKGAADWPWRDVTGALARSYQLADGLRVTRAARAIACGVVAMVAKDIVGHGQFSEWLKSESLSFLNPRTTRNYMAAARACLIAQDIKPGAIKRSGFIRWAFDVFAGDIDKDAVYQSVVDYIGERSLWEIYVDEGIARERDSHQKHTPPSQTPAEQVQLELALVVETWQKIRSNLVVQTSTKAWEILPKDARLAFLEDALPAVSNLALNTSWTPSERVAIHQRLVSITTALAGAKGGQ